MRLFTPIVPDRRAPLARANPLAKLVAALVLLVALFASLDGVTAGSILAVLVALVPVSGIGWRPLLSRIWPLLLVAVAIAAFSVLFAADQRGSELARLGPVRIGAETLLNGLGLGLRLVAIVLTGILATATSDPTELAGALVQQARVSPPFAIGVLAALRLAPLLSREWETLGMARRARGVDAGRSAVGAARLVAGRMAALLVGAIRRGSRMALAMEGRGFGALPCRAVARPQRMRPSDWVWMAGAVAVAAASIASSVMLGTWRPLL